MVYDTPSPPQENPEKGVESELLSLVIEDAQERNPEKGVERWMTLREEDFIAVGIPKRELKAPWSMLDLE